MRHGADTLEEIDPMDAVPLEERMWIRFQRDVLRKHLLKSFDFYFFVIGFLACEAMTLFIAIRFSHFFSMSTLTVLFLVGTGLLGHFLSHLRALQELNGLQWTDASAEGYWQKRVVEVTEGSPAEKIFIIARNVTLQAPIRIYFSILWLLAMLNHYIASSTQ